MYGAMTYRNARYRLYCYHIVTQSQYTKPTSLIAATTPTASFVGSAFAQAYFVK